MKIIPFIFLHILLFLVVGCGESSSYSVISEKEETLYQKGIKYNRAGQKTAALNAYLKLIERRRDAPESHLEVGQIYLKELGDPITAIYHFGKYLEAKPDVEQSPMVRQMIETAKKVFIKSLPGRSTDNELERVDLMRLLKETRNENLRLRKIIAQIQTSGNNYTVVNPGASFNEDPTFAPISEERSRKIYPEYYTVKEGDSLSRISQTVYGSSAYWQKIYASNRDLLSTPHSLKVGQVLKVPAKTN